jgi:hypothetical protein
MVGYAALRQARASHQIADTQLSIKELLQDTQPQRVSQTAKKLGGDLLHLGVLSVKSSGL